MKIERILTCEIVVAEKKQKNNSSPQGDIHEKGLSIKSFIKLNNLNSLIEHGINEHVSEAVSVLQVDHKTDGATGKCVGRNEGVSDSCLLLRFDDLVVGNGGEVLDVVGEVHGVSEGCFDVVQDHLLISFVSEPDQELRNLTGGQFYKILRLQIIVINENNNFYFLNLFLNKLPSPNTNKNS